MTTDRQIGPQQAYAQQIRVRQIAMEAFQRRIGTGSNKVELLVMGGDPISGLRGAITPRGRYHKPGGNYRRCG